MECGRGSLYIPARTANTPGRGLGLQMTFNCLTPSVPNGSHLGSPKRENAKTGEQSITKTPKRVDERMSGDLNCADQGLSRFWPDLVSAFLIFDNWGGGQSACFKRSQVQRMCFYQISGTSGCARHRNGPTEGID